MLIEKTLQIPCGQTYLIKTTDGNFIECGDVFMSRENGIGTRPYHFSDFENPSDLEKRVMTISTMAGCPCHCTFCASRKSFKRNLSATEIIEQVITMSWEGMLNNRRLAPDEAKEFRVLFTRMGEPMLNIDNVIRAIQVLIQIFPNIIIGMSTSGYKEGVQKLLDCPEILPHIDMQFSVHSTEQWVRDVIFGSLDNLDLHQIASYSTRWFEATGKKVGLNFILFDDGVYNFNQLEDRYGFNRDHVWIRLSPWNEVEDLKSEFRSLLITEDVVQKKPVTSIKLKDIIDNLNQSGISYSYAPAIDEEIKYNVACGQALAAFKDIL